MPHINRYDEQKASHRSAVIEIDSKKLKMMTTTIIFAASILCCASAVSGTEIRQVELDGSMLIDTSPTNYAITSPDLEKQHNWKSVSINGNQVTILTSTCQNVAKQPQDLSQDERAQLTSVASRLIVADSIGNPNGGPTINHQGRHSSARFELTSGGSMRSSRSEGMSMSSFQSNGLSVNKYDDSNYSISKPDLPNAISRLFVSNGDLVTFVYADGQVQMKPVACLDANESQLFQGLQTEVRQAQQHFEASMRQMQQNMHQNMMNMQQNLHQNMQQMHHNMANMFSHNSAFPFGSGAGAASAAGFNPNGHAQAYAGAHNNYNNPQGAASFASGAGASSFMAPVAPMAPMNPFGNNFPFGPVNSPFGHGFPFGR